MTEQSAREAVAAALEEYQDARLDGGLAVWEGQVLSTVVAALLAEHDALLSQHSALCDLHEATRQARDLAIQQRDEARFIADKKHAALEQYQAEVKHLRAVADAARRVDAIHRGPQGPEIMALRKALEALEVTP